MANEPLFPNAETVVIEEQQEQPKTEEPPVVEKDSAPAEPPAKPRLPRSNRELLDLIIESGDNSKGYAQQVVEAELLRDQFDQDQRLARVFAESGIFADIKGHTERQMIAVAMTKIQLGRSWNLSPADAMQFIYFTNGRPAVMTELYGAKLQENGYTWDVAYEYETIPGSSGTRKRRKCIGCTVFPKKWCPETKSYEPMTQKEFTDTGDIVDVALSVSFTRDDADGAMIWEKGKQIKLSDKWNFQSWPEDMYFWRALSKFRRRHAPNVLRGAITREEAEEMRPSTPAVSRPLFPTRGDSAAETQDEADARQLAEELAKEQAGLFPDADKGGKRK